MKTFILGTIIFISSVNDYAQTGRVGINTSNPKNTLHIHGTVRIDSVSIVSLDTIDRIMALDHHGVISSVPLDSLSSPATPVVYGASLDASATTTSTNPQTRVSLQLNSGMYVIFAYYEVMNTNLDAGVRAWFYEGSTEVSYGIVYSNTGTFGSWSTMKWVNPTSTTTYKLSWSSWPGGTVSYVRRARICAIRVW